MKRIICIVISMTILSIALTGCSGLNSITGNNKEATGMIGSGGMGGGGGMPPDGGGGQGGPPGAP